MVLFSKKFECKVNKIKYDSEKYLVGFI